SLLRLLEHLIHRDYPLLVDRFADEEAEECRVSALPHSDDRLVASMDGMDEGLHGEERRIFALYCRHLLRAGVAGRFALQGDEALGKVYSRLGTDQLLISRCELGMGWGEPAMYPGIGQSALVADDRGVVVADVALRVFLLKQVLPARAISANRELAQGPVQQVPVV